jgi:hypothetical protein
MAEGFTVVAADLPSYGRSAPTATGSKREMSAVLVEVMADLGFERFWRKAVLGKGEDQQSRSLHSNDFPGGAQARLGMDWALGLGTRRLVVGPQERSGSKHL